MREQRISDVPERDSWLDQRVVLDLLVQSHPTLWSVTELARAICSSQVARRDGELGTSAVEDALQDLYGAGLVHRSGDVAFATRAAVEGARLQA